MKEGGTLMQNETLEHYLWAGLDYERYEVVRIIPQNTQSAAIIMKSQNDYDTPWCIEYRGCGHYFETFKELQDFYRERFRKELEEM